MLFGRGYLVLKRIHEKAQTQNKFIDNINIKGMGLVRLLLEGRVKEKYLIIKDNSLELYNITDDSNPKEILLSNIDHVIKPIVPETDFIVCLESPLYDEKELHFMTPNRNEIIKGFHAVNIRINVKKKLRSHTMILEENDEEIKEIKGRENDDEILLTM